MDTKKSMVKKTIRKWFFLSPFSSGTNWTKLEFIVFYNYFENHLVHLFGISLNHKMKNLPANACLCIFAREKKRRVGIVWCRFIRTQVETRKQKNIKWKRKNYIENSLIHFPSVESIQSAIAIVNIFLLIWKKKKPKMSWTEIIRKELLEMIQAFFRRTTQIDGYCWYVTCLYAAKCFNICKYCFSRFETENGEEDEEENCLSVWKNEKSDARAWTKDVCFLIKRESPLANICIKYLFTGFLFYVFFHKYNFLYVFLHL